MEGYKFNTIAEVNTAIQTINTTNNFMPIQGNVTQTLVSVMEMENFYFIRLDEYSQCLGISIEVTIPVNPLN
jgi:hypothetical protein